MQALARHCGFWSAPAQSLAITAPDVPALEAAVARLPREGLTGALALGAVRHPDGKATAALLAAPGRIRLDALSRTDAETLSGHALAGGEGLELWADDGVKLKLTTTPTGSLRGTIPAQTRTLEIARWSGRFRQTLALLEFGPKPETYTPVPPPAASGGGVPQALLEAVNAHREASLTLERRLGTALDDWLARVAGAGRASEAPKGLVDTQGWPYADLHFALTAGQDAAQAISRLAELPTGRALLRDEGVRRIAFGSRPHRNGIDVVVVTLRPFEQRPASEARTLLLTGLNEAREARSLPALQLAEPLTAAAQAVAESALAGETRWPRVVRVVMDRTKAARLARGAFGAGGFTAVEPDGADFAEQPQALAKGMAYVGIGVTAGPLPGGAAPRYVVVFVVAERLAEKPKG